MKRRLSYFLTLLGASLFALFPLLAQEHPEHPTDEAKQEHPEHPEEAKDFSTADLEKAIKAEISSMSEKTGGAFELEDAELDKTWRLTLDKVHTDRLSKLDADTYFACVDMTDASGTTIDVDFFLESKDGKLAMNDTTVHKIDGKPRYTWMEEDGFWKRVPVEDTEG